MKTFWFYALLPFVVVCLIPIIFLIAYYQAHEEKIHKFLGTVACERRG